jgi:hypothetical protein
MPQYLLRLDREHDAYVMFSTVVDGVVTEIMSREQAWRHLLARRGGPEELIESAVVRADLSGTSAKDGEYGWDDGPVLFLDGGACNKTVPRDELYEYLTGGS